MMTHAEKCSCEGGPVSVRGPAHDWHRISRVAYVVWLPGRWFVPNGLSRGRCFLCLLLATIADAGAKLGIHSVYYHAIRLIGKVRSLVCPRPTIRG